MDSSTQGAAAEMFGALLRHLREQAGISTKDLAAAVRNSPHTVTSWERGARIPHVDTVKEVDRYLNGRDALVVAVKKLKAPKPYPTFFGPFAEEEAKARSLYSYESLVIPGVLQTEAYARAVIAGYCPTPDDDEVEAKVAARQERQALITRRPPPTLGFVIQEWVLRQPLGGEGVLRAQLMRLLEISELRHVTLQVMPTLVTTHVGTDGPMVLLDTADGRSLAYVEGQGASFWVSSPTEVAILHRRYGILRAQALNVKDSVQLIRQMAGAL